MRVRQTVKAALFMLSLLLVSPLIACTWLEKRLTRAELVFVCCGQLLALCPGQPGSFLRAAFFFATLDECSWEIHVGFGSLITHRAASLGRYASMGSYCVIGHARLGERVMMGSRVSIPSGKHQHLDVDGRLTTENTRFETVSIGRETWVGEGAIIMADVGSRCIVSAGAVVTKQAPDASVLGGNPARVLARVEAASDCAAVS